MAARASAWVNTWPMQSEPPGRANSREGTEFITDQSFRGAPCFCAKWTRARRDIVGSVWLEHERFSPQRARFGPSRPRNASIVLYCVIILYWILWEIALFMTSVAGPSVHRPSSKGNAWLDFQTGIKPRDLHTILITTHRQHPSWHFSRLLYYSGLCPAR